MKAFCFGGSIDCANDFKGVTRIECIQTYGREHNAFTGTLQRLPNVVKRIAQRPVAIQRSCVRIVQTVDENGGAYVAGLEVEREDAARGSISVAVNRSSINIAEDRRGLTSKFQFQFILTICRATKTRVRNQRVVVFVVSAADTDQIGARFEVDVKE